MRFIRKQSWLLLCCLMFVHNSYTQNNNSENLYSWFDNQVGSEDISLNNGLIHYNTYRTGDKNNFRYYKNEFLKGNVTYDNQKFYNVDLKYDLFTDALLYQPEGSAYSINLIKEKVSNFYIDGKHFVNLSLEKNSPEFVSGYYEENVVSERFIFYIKYIKKIREKIKENTSLSEFRTEDTYLLYYKNNYTNVTSKKDVILIFPEYKSKINDFYLMNKKLAKSDTSQFMKNLFAYINQISIK